MTSTCEVICTIDRYRSWNSHLS